MTEILRREVPAGKEPIGESWELVDRDGEVSILENGPMAGATLHELLQNYGKALLGSKAPEALVSPLLQGANPKSCSGNEDGMGDAAARACVELCF